MDFRDNVLAHCLDQISAKISYLAQKLLYFPRSLRFDFQHRKEKKSGFTIQTTPLVKLLKAFFSKKNSFLTCNENYEIKSKMMLDSMP